MKDVLRSLAHVFGGALVVAMTWGLLALLWSFT